MPIVNGFLAGTTIPTFFPYTVYRRQNLATLIGIQASGIPNKGVKVPTSPLANSEVSLVQGASMAF